MALGSLPDLLAINAELDLTLQGLNECITASGEAFDDQLDFAGWSVPVDITVTYDLSTTITTKTNTTRIIDQWRRVDILPSGSGREGAEINFKATYDLSESLGINIAEFYYGIGGSSTAEPTWLSINTSNSSGTTTVIVGDGSYLFVRLRVDRQNIEAGDWADAEITLINGNVIAPNTGTVTASGSPLTWNVTVGIPT